VEVTHGGAVLSAGIVANNASGMCCGVANNTYNTLDHMRIVFADGALLDTADKDSCERFLKASEAISLSQAAKQLWFGLRTQDLTGCTTFGLGNSVPPEVGDHSCAAATIANCLLVAPSMVLAVGSDLTHDPAVLSLAAWWFRQTHGQLCDAVSQLASEVQDDEALSTRIKHKFKIKNTVRGSNELTAVSALQVLVMLLVLQPAAQHAMLLYGSQDVPVQMEVCAGLCKWPVCPACCCCCCFRLATASTRWLTSLPVIPSASLSTSWWDLRGHWALCLM
jgi:hypothetical protein